MDNKKSRYLFCNPLRLIPIQAHWSWHQKDSINQSLFLYLYPNITPNHSSGVTNLNIILLLIFQEGLLLRNWHMKTKNIMFLVQERLVLRNWQLYTFYPTQCIRNGERIEPKYRTRPEVSKLTPENWGKLKSEQIQPR